MPDDWATEPTGKRWIKHVLTDMKPKMEESVLVMSLVPSSPEGDVKFWVELGASICMDKPLLVVVMGDDVIPSKLEMIADEIVRLPEGVTAEASKDMAAALVRMNERFGL